MVFEHASALPESGSEVNKRQGFKQVSAKRFAAAGAESRVIKGDPFRSGSRVPTPRRLGYIRVSTTSQVTDRQTVQLEAECDALHVEYVFAVAADRPVFEAVLAELSAGDTFIVQDLDRAFRSSIDAMLTAEALRQRGVNFRILSLNVDTRTPEGELFPCGAPFSKLITDTFQDLENELNFWCSECVISGLYYLLGIGSCR